MASSLPQDTDAAVVASVGTVPVQVVSITRTPEDPPHEDVLPHPDDYCSEAHIARLLAAEFAARTPPISIVQRAADEHVGARMGLAFYLEHGAPSGFVDATVRHLCDQIAAVCSAVTMLNVQRAHDAEIDANVYHLTFRTPGHVEVA